MELREGTRQLVEPLLRVWNAIGHDVEEGMQACGEELDNEVAIESCLDADHLLLTGDDPEAHALCRALCREHGFSVVVRDLSRQITLA